MSDELSPQELEQFKAMEAQEAEETKVIETEKAEPVEPAEPEAQVVEPKPEPKPEPKEVPLAALQEERERRKVAEAAARQAEINQARLDERLKAINERLNPPEVKVIPDPEKDPMGALKATQEELKTLREYQQGQVQQTQQNAYVNDIAARAIAQEIEFMKQTSDYGDASVYLKKSRAEEMTALGMNPLQIQQALANEGLQLADAALRQGQNPAEVIYKLAKSRGYVKAGAQIVQAQPMGDAEKLANIAQGQKANTSLGNVNSTPAKPAISGKEILAMDDEQFNAWISKLPAKEQQKYFGA